MPVYALAGRKLGHSFSKAWFTAKFEREGLEDHHYINIETEEVSQIPSLVIEKGLAGFNVTHPYKTEIIPYLQQLDSDAARIHAVNTVKVSKDGKLKGFNTDLTGFRESIKPHLKACHSHALLFGTGGASRAVASILQELGIEFLYVSRGKKDENTLLYQELTALDIRNAPLLINSTPLGTFPDVNTAPDIPYEGIEKYHLLFDLVYNPSETKFLKMGRIHGAATLNGYDMLVRQAQESWKIWNDPLR